MNHTRSEQSEPRRDLSVRGRATDADANTAAALRRAITSPGGSAGDAPLPATIRANRASIPQKSSHLAAGKLRSRTRLRQLRRRQDCDPLPNKSRYRNSGRSESGCDTRYQLRARIFCARLGDEPVLSDTSHRNGMLCRFGADMPCSGIDKRALGRPWRQRGATRSDTIHFVP